MEPIAALTIAGSDCSGGAGIQADLKTMMALGVYGMSVITAVTAQNTTGVREFAALNPALVASQIDIVMSDIPPMAIKTGMLANADIIRAVADTLGRFKPTPLVVDPVMVATSGDQLIDDGAIDAVTELLFPIATLVTPNVNEARRLTGSDNPSQQAARLHGLGARNVLLKGGDRDSEGCKVDILSLDNGDETIRFTAPTIDTPNTHGTGCTLSSAIASFIALGDNLTNAVSRAKRYISLAISAAQPFTIGHGHGPVNHVIAHEVDDDKVFL